MPDARRPLLTQIWPAKTRRAHDRRNKLRPNRLTALMNLLGTDLIYPVLGAILAGACIGAEREYRSSPAGIRTHIIVSLSCCLLMLSAVHQVHWLTDTPDEIIRIDPVRMAHGILTGIGFLCGGVIFREGLSVRGLTTAASLWSTSALGILFGIGFYALAIIGSVATLLILAAATLTERFFPQRCLARITVRYKRQAAPSRQAFGLLLADHGYEATTVSQKSDAAITEYGVTLNGGGDRKTESLLVALDADTSVCGLDFHPHDS